MAPKFDPNAFHESLKDFDIDCEEGYNALLALRRCDLYDLSKFHGMGLPARTLKGDQLYEIMMWYIEKTILSSVFIEEAEASRVVDLYMNAHDAAINLCEAEANLREK